jgi:Tol biopolymer transport system component
VLTGVGATALFTLIGVFGWRLVENFVPESNARDLVFASDRDGDWEIYLKRDQLTQQLTTNDYDDLNPRWSPRGDFIAYESFQSTNWNLMRINADGTDPGMLRDNESNERWFSWAPDSSNFAYASDRDGDWEIFVSEPGYSERQLTFNDYDDVHPVWDPKGRFIVFESLYDGDWEVYRMRVDGSGVRVYTINTDNDQAPDVR